LLSPKKRTKRDGRRNCQKREQSSQCDCYRHTQQVAEGAEHYRRSGSRADRAGIKHAEGPRPPLRADKNRHRT
jgi:hypothetical protein